MAPQIIPVVDEGLGNSSYVVDLGDGGALVVDAFRDPAPYLQIAERRGLRLRYAAETHLHADYVSGSRELAAAGAQVLASAGAPLAFPARHVGDGDEIDMAGLTLRALATPGHTPEHLSYLLLDAGQPVAAFTGGTLIVGGVARPDLLGPELTEPLARAAYRSLHEVLLGLPDEVAVLPTHGSGSLCSTGAGGERTSTIGAERRANPLLQAPDEQTFAARLLDGLGSFPPYFLELREVNQAGPDLYGTEPPPVRQLSPEAFEQVVGSGAELIDVRPISSFAAGHIPGALSIAQRPQFATWLGWLVERSRPLVFVADERTDRRELVRACLGIGYEQLAGEAAGGVAAWSATGRPLAQIPLVPPAQAPPGRRIVDVRQLSEGSHPRLADAVRIELGELEARRSELAGEPLLVHCEHGDRAMTGASLLARAGHRQVAALSGGPAELAAAFGLRLSETA